MSAERTFLENLGRIDRIAAFVARRNHLNPDETSEFIQEVRVRLIEDDYAIIRKFESRSSFSTYLTTVIMRLYQQWRVQMWGKWRPSAEARRLGDKAITLERLITRDGYTFAEAVNVLTTPSSSKYTLAELEAIYSRLPLRNPRVSFVAPEVIPETPAPDSDADDRVEMHERERVARKVAAAVDRLLPLMDAEDRLILQLRFWQALKVPEIARRLHMDQKKLYKRLERIFVMMRRALAEAGVAKADIDMLCNGDQDMHFAFPIGKIPPIGPSNNGGGSIGGGGGKNRLR